MKSLLENLDLMTYKISFNYSKNAVYHSFFGILISMCVYGCMIFLTGYFIKDFVNKTNPINIYQETEFEYADNFSLLINFILNDYYYAFNFATYENLYNLTSDENSKDIFNIPNEFFSLQIYIENNIYNSTSLFLIENIDVTSIKIISGNLQYFHNRIRKSNCCEQIFNLNFSQNTPSKIFVSEKGLKFNKYNITIDPQLKIILYLKKIKEIPNLFPFYFSFSNLDNLINLNNPDFYKKFSKTYNNLIDSFLRVTQGFNFDYGVVKTLDDAGIIFSEIKSELRLKKFNVDYLPRKFG